MNEFEMNTRYAGFYQNDIKKDFVSSKLFVLLCAFTFATSLISISYLSNIDKRTTQAQRFIPSLTIPQFLLASKKEATVSKINLASANSPAAIEKITPKEQPTPASKTIAPEVNSNKKLDLLMLTPQQQIKMLASNITPPKFLPVLPSKVEHTLAPKKPSATAPSSNLVVVDFKIKKSLSKDTKQAGFSHYLTKELAHAFSEKLDIKKVRPGDRFTVLYRKNHPDSKIKSGQILAAKYISRNKVIKVVRLNEGRHKSAFLPLDKLHEISQPQSTVSILRKPVKSGRVSSPFHHHRFHPILKRYRAHLGVDYAAPAGSPIVASGSGKVTYVGYQHGYGNLVTIQHDKKYSTRYGHMARFAKIKVGSQIKQGQVIGYVGKTGYATGHHVHYEIRINGKPYNPLTVALPNARKTPTISKKRRHELASKAKMLFAKMDELNRKKSG